MLALSRIKCSRCGTVLYSRARSCYACGEPLAAAITRATKRLGVAYLLLVLLSPIIAIAYVAHGCSHVLHARLRPSASPRERPAQPPTTGRPSRASHVPCRAGRAAPHR